ncbi:MAG TPA: amino acid permease [Pyrinomonadaceae bacterium]|nr:amino acid permease [Pyrinomonadaceae bacterium]
MTEEKLVRGLGRWDLTAITINTIIGAGIFGLPAKAYGLIGSYSLLAFIACAIVTGLIVLCYAEVSSRFSATGGPYLYAKEAFGSFVGFEVGWLYWIVRLTTIAANLNLFVTYLGFFDQRLSTGTYRIVIIILVIGTIAIVNFIGVRQSAVMTNIFTVGKLLPLFALALVGLIFVQPSNFSFDVVPEYGSFTSAVLLLIYAFVGFEVMVILGGESRDPKQNMPFALLVAIGIVAVVYILIQIVCIGTVPNLAASERPLADAAASFLGVAGATVITAGALVSILGNLNVGFLGGSRLIFAMAEQRDLPSFLELSHERFKTPYAAILVSTVILTILTIQSSFFTAVAIATITRLMVYVTTCAAMLVFRYRKDAPAPGFVAPFGVVVCILSIALIVWLLTNVDFRKEGLPILIAAGAGLVIYLGYRWLRNFSGETKS